MIVVIPCGVKKRKGSWPAFQLYCGSYFTAALKAALRVVGRDHVLILSGNYGLLHLTDIVQSYEQRIDEPGHVALEQVHQQAAQMGIKGDQRGSKGSKC